MATLNGAIALGGSKDFGSLEVGKQADFIAVNLGGIDQQPMYNVLSHLVYACNRTCVTDVWVSGQQLMADRKLTSIDEAEVLREISVRAPLPVVTHPRTSSCLCSFMLHCTPLNTQFCRSGLQRSGQGQPQCTRLRSSPQRFLRSICTSISLSITSRML